MSRIGFLLLVTLAAVLTAACGTVATPEWAAEAQGTQAALLATDEHLTAIAPTATPLPPTATPVPPTETPIPPTATPLPPTETPPPTATEVPTEEVVAQTAADPLANADPVNGQAVFMATHDTASGPWACSTCHSVTADELRLVGPGLYNVSVRAETRVAGQTAYEYVHNSIIHPNDFIVPADPPYPPGLMPQNFEEVLTEQEINDIIAYLFTLKG